HGQIGRPPPVALYRDGVVTRYTDVEIGWEQGFVQSTRHFLRVLDEGGEPVLTARQARTVLRFALGAEESARTGKAVLLGEDDE
ncbi:MAG: hypothetical protein OXI66_08095, partial [Boseongicola sp.]|nr:hypothetical protein [Boseongicola sp.]